MNLRFRYLFEITYLFAEAEAEATILIKVC
jgi:hypothetical protein